MVAISFMLIYRISHFFHFAHGIVLASGAYLTCLFKMYYDLPLSISILFAIMLSVLLGCFIEILFYRPLVKKKSHHLILLLVSLGVYIVIENAISILWGSGLKVIRLGDIEEGMSFFNASITPPQIAMIIASLAISSFIVFVLQKTKIGYMVRAVASDRELA
ncbi:MAG: branched-chain amino acid ABC transporter permease, partial [Desulfobacterales bacterium]|nr:branched-chain amino acid ABC transporter permease [Desulfobacterales bacterium]